MSTLTVDYTMVTFLFHELFHPRFEKIQLMWSLWSILCIFQHIDAYWNIPHQFQQTPLPTAAWRVEVQFTQLILSTYTLCQLFICELIQALLGLEKNSRHIPNSEHVSEQKHKAIDVSSFFCVLLDWFLLFLHLWQD